MSATVRPAYLCPPISRVDIAWTCVSTNDGHPLHIDHEFAQQAGFKDVVVPGTMVAGWIGEYLAAWADGAENIVDWRLRLLTPVWPGERVRIEGRSAENAEGDDKQLCEVTATNELGTIVARAWAELRRKPA